MIHNQMTYAVSAQVEIVWLLCGLTLNHLKIFFFVLLFNYIYKNCGHFFPYEEGKKRASGILGYFASSVH